MAKSFSVSNNIKFQVFQKCFQNVQLFSINPIKCFNVYTDTEATSFIKTAWIFNGIQYVNGEC